MGHMAVGLSSCVQFVPHTASYIVTSSKNCGRIPSLISESNSMLSTPGGGRVRSVINS